MVDHEKEPIPKKALVEIARSIVITPDDAPESVQTQRKREAGFFIEIKKGNLLRDPEKIAKNLREFITRVKTQGANEPNAQLEAQERVCGMFRQLVVLTATDHPILNELNLSVEQIAGGLYEGAIDLLIGTQKQIGVKTGLHLPKYRNAPSGTVPELQKQKATLEKFSNALLQGSSTASTTSRDRR